MPQFYLSKEKLDELKKELDNLKKIERPKIADRIAAAKELGDLSENAEYAEAREAQAFVEGKIMELENTIKFAAIIEHHDSNVVDIGSVVTVKIDKKKVEYTIVGSQEADPVTHKISNVSPMGRAFLGKKIGDKVVISAPKGDFVYEIVDIS